MTHVVPRDRELFESIQGLGVPFTDEELTVFAEIFEERAAILEYEANVPRAEAESKARWEVFCAVSIQAGCKK